MTSLNSSTIQTKDFYGIGVYTQIDYDAITMGFENIFFSYGAEWSDEDFNVLGVVNSPEAVAALELYQELYSFAPPGTNNAFFAEMNDIFITGQAPMIMNYFAFFPALDNAEVNPYRDDTGYFAMPAGPDGDRFAALGGQGISINSYISDARQEASYDFIRWFAQEEVQARWAELGGYTSNINVLGIRSLLEPNAIQCCFRRNHDICEGLLEYPRIWSIA